MTEMIKQQYHLEPNRGLLNDPNGLSWFNGKYHVFFQWNRFEKDHSYKEWGLFTSEDLLKWKFEGSAILPDQEYDKDGVYSGCGYVINNQLFLFYTGNTKTDGIRKSYQCLAVTTDGRRYQKKGVVLNTPEDFTEHFRDPKVFIGKRSCYYMIVGAQQKNGKGAIALCSSKDGEKWEYKKMLAMSENYEMIECPDLFELDGRFMLIYNPQRRNNETDETLESFTAYKIVEFDEENKRLSDDKLDDRFLVMDSGFDFYAPQTFLSPDGRRILFAWMSRMENEQERVFSKNEKNIHCLTLPRELSIKDNKLCQKPIRELYELLGNRIEMFEDSTCYKVKSVPRTFFLYMIRKNIKSNLDIMIDQGDVSIKYNAQDGKMYFSRKNWVDDSMDTKTVMAERCSEIEIWSDCSSIEVFVNGGEIVFTARIYPVSKDVDIVIDNQQKDMEIIIKEINTLKKKEDIK